MADNLGYKTRVVQLTTARAVAFTTKFSQALSMDGYDGVMFIVQGSTLLNKAAASNIKVYAQGSTAAAGTYVSMQGYAQSTQTAGVNYRNIVLDCHKPIYPYVRCRVTGSSSNASNINSILAIQYNARKPGSTHYKDSTTLGGIAVIAAATS